MCAWWWSMLWNETANVITSDIECEWFRIVSVVKSLLSNETKIDYS